MAEATPKRRLAAIVSADVVAYSQLMGDDEVGTLVRLKAHRQELIDPTIAKHDGRVVKLIGDGILIEFPSAVEAVSWGVEVQQAMVVRNKDIPEAQRIVFRVGINLGDIIIEGEDIYGDGVNIAARLEALAEPGSVYISEDIHRQVQDKLDFSFDDLGTHQVKNIARAVRVYRVGLESEASGVPTISGVPQAKRLRWAALALAGVVIAVLVGVTGYWQPWEQPSGEKSVATKPQEHLKSGLPSTDKPSIAVLPFNNMSNDPEQEYFVDGMTEDLITDLSKVSGLLVIARTSAFVYKGQFVNIQKVAQELNVRYVLEGSVRKAGDRIRINAQLIDAVSGGHLWAERYDRQLADIFDLQDEVTETIVSALAVNLTQDEQKRLAAQNRTIDTDAYDVLLRGLGPLRLFTKEGVAEARAFFEQAITLDPDYARAYANLALTYSREVNFGLTDQPEESVRLGFEAAAKAEALDESIPQLHFTRATLHLANREHDEASAAARRSIELDSNYADGYAVLAQAQSYAGALAEATSAIHTAKRLNPRYPFAYLWIEGHILFLQERYDEAIPLLREAIWRNPSFYTGHLTLAATYGQLGKIDEAEWEVEEILTLNSDFSIAAERRAVAYKKAEDLERYIEGLRKAGLPE